MRNCRTATPAPSTAEAEVASLAPLAAVVPAPQTSAQSDTVRAIDKDHANDHHIASTHTCCQ